MELQRLSGEQFDKMVSAAKDLFNAGNFGEETSNCFPLEYPDLCAGNHCTIAYDLGPVGEDVDGTPIRALAKKNKHLDKWEDIGLWLCSGNEKSWSATDGWNISKEVIGDEHLWSKHRYPESWVG